MRKVFLSILFILPFAFSLTFSPLFAQTQTQTETPSYTEIQDKATIPILTPSAALRKTAKLKLANGLQVYIVSDPSADQSAAALSVEVGSWEDPVEVPGMAHFIEHMLFLGTEKYPVESEYDRFITEHGGMSNAYTADTETNYIFSVDDIAFPQALDRFASFFKEPLFNASGLSRELQAIDQEYAKNMDSDDVRQYFVMKELSNPKHPDHLFSIGNSDTLSQVPRDTIKNWYEQHYSANLMHLAIYSPLPLDQLKKLVINDFSDIPNRHKSPFKLNQPLVSAALNGHFIYITPLKNSRVLTLAWELPSTFSHMLETKPEEIISSVLGNEGQKSLLAELKKGHLAESLKSGVLKPGPDNEKFIIQIELTVQGLKNINEVIEKVFQAIANFKQKGTPEYLFEELQHLEKAAYQYPSRPKAFQVVSKLASEMIDEDLETYPEKSSIIQNFDPKAVQDFLAMLTPQYGQFYVMAPPSATEIKPDKKERWMGIPYTIKAIPKETLEAWANVQPTPEMDLPPPNPFIPEHLSLVNPVSGERAEVLAYPHPHLIFNEPRGKIYFAIDKHYLTPELYCSFEIKSPKINDGVPEQVVQTDLYIKSLSEAINKMVYPAQLAGLEQKVERSNYNGISLTISGYSEKAHLLLEEILKQLKSVKPSEEAFQIYKEALLREYQNSSKDSPLERAKEKIKEIVYKDFVSEKAKALAIDNITYKDFLDYLNTLYNHTFTEGIIYGNINESQALELWKMLDNTLQSQAYLPEERNEQEVIQLPTKTGPYFVEFRTKTPGNATILAIQHQPFSFKTRAAQQILSQAIEEPFYSTLRTKQQTGYLVYNWDEELELQLFSFFADQSNTHSPRDLLSRFELTIEAFIQEINEDLSQERFKIIQESVASNLMQLPENLKKMGENLENIAFHYDGDFDWLEKRIQGIKNLTYEECVSFAKESYGRVNKQRVAVLLRGTIPPQNEFHYNRVENIQALRKLSRYFPRTSLKQ